MSGPMNFVLPMVRFRDGFLDDNVECAKLWWKMIDSGAKSAAGNGPIQFLNGTLTIRFGRGVAFYGIGAEPADWEGGAGGAWVILAYGWEIRLTPEASKRGLPCFRMEVGLAPGYGDVSPA